jgi:hypothetical protein
MTAFEPQYGRVIGTMDPTSFHKGPSRLLRASQGSDEETGKAAYRSYPLRFPPAILPGENRDRASRHPRPGATWGR